MYTAIYLSLNCHCPEYCSHMREDIYNHISAFYCIVLEWLVLSPILMNSFEKLVLSNIDISPTTNTGHQLFCLLPEQANRECHFCCTSFSSYPSGQHDNHMWKNALNLILALLLIHSYPLRWALPSSRAWMPGLPSAARFWLLTDLRLFGWAIACPLPLFWMVAFHRAVCWVRCSTPCLSMTLCLSITPTWLSSKQIIPRW